VIRRCIGSGDVRGRFEAEDGNGRRFRLGGGPSGRLPLEDKSEGDNERTNGDCLMGNLGGRVNVM
jgi:hypothetical protein